MNPQAAPISSIFSGADIELTKTVEGASPFSKSLDKDVTALVLVIVAEVAPSSYVVVVKEDPRDTDVLSTVIFSQVINDDFIMDTQSASRMIAIRSSEMEFWYQLTCEGDTTYWGLLGAITHVQRDRKDHESLVNTQLSRLERAFLDYFSPKFAPYDDPEQLAHIRKCDEDLKTSVSTVGPKHGRKRSSSEADLDDDNKRSVVREVTAEIDDNDDGDERYGE
ncbi:hypothetical protein C8Q76DRAFT_798460 [Earliella scabrosa]|nr:hypothetical protein C8Q76DRAFT_798460 [Earliella scabrosa]